MADELAGKPVGERILAARNRTGKSREVVAGLVGRTAAWLRKVESGEIKNLPIDMLLALARAIGVRDLTELTGEHELLIGVNRRAAHPVVPAIREAIEAVEFGPPASTVAAPELAARVERAWRLWHTSANPRADAGAMLPELITDGRRALRTLEGQDKRTAAAALAGAYALSEQILAWVADSPLLWLAADRCMSAAEIADEPVTMAAASWVLGNVWRATGREEDAYKLALDAINLLEPHLDNNELARALWGSCQLHSAITAGKLGREGDALRAMDRADTMATAMPAGYAHPWTLFGRPNTDLTLVSVQVELRKGSDALDAAGHVDPEGVPSTDRKARLYLEGARAYGLGRDWNGALGMLERATSVSEESMRCHPLSRHLADEIVLNGGRLIERPARALAQRLGLAA